MLSEYHFTRKFGLFYGDHMNYSIIRSGDIPNSGNSLFVVTDKNPQYIRYQMKKNKFEQFKGGKKSHLSIRILEKARLIVATSSDFKVYFWQMNTGKKRSRYNHINIVTNFMYNEQETLGVSLCHKGSVSIIDLKKMERIKYVKNFSVSLWISNTFAFNFQKMMFFGNTNNREKCQIYHMGRKRLFKMIMNETAIENFLYVPKFKKYIMANKLGIFIINVDNLKYFRKFSKMDSFTGGVYALGSCRNGRIVLVGSSNGSLMGYNVELNRKCFILKQSGSVFHFKLCTNKQFVVSSGDKSAPLKVWDVNRTIDYYINRSAKGVINV